MSDIAIVFLLFGITSAAVSDWSYTRIATTNEGRECINECKNNRCVVDWKMNYKECKESDVPAPKYRTAEVIQKKYEYCLSNCGFFGYEYEWCVTTNDRGWDYCNSGTEHRSIYKAPCKETCDTHFGNYYWCYVAKGSWQYCAVPREEIVKKEIVQKEILQKEIVQKETVQKEIVQKYTVQKEIVQKDTEQKEKDQKEIGQKDSQVTNGI
ncbi:hypothetical protein O0L34_g4730 [Tuta absoluta]|nr:hypothetical protein O0L34_g4730 [Tuta absoluta]